MSFLSHIHTSHQAERKGRNTRLVKSSLAWLQAAEVCCRFQKRQAEPGPWLWMFLSFSIGESGLCPPPPPHPMHIPFLGLSIAKLGHLVPEAAAQAGAPQRYLESCWNELFAFSMECMVVVGGVRGKL